MTIYAIDQAILDLVDPETGEITDFSALESVMSQEKRVENIACYYKDCIADAEKIRTEEKALAERRRVLERRAERLGDYLTYMLQGQKFESARCQVTFRKNSSVNVTNNESVTQYLYSKHKELLTFHEPTFKKPDIAKLLKSGEAIPGAEMVTSYSMGVK